LNWRLKKRRAFSLEVSKDVSPFAMVSVQELNECDLTNTKVEQLLGVLKQLSSSVTETSIRNAVSSSQSQVLVAIVEEKIVASTTMAFLCCVTGIRVHIEDVIVDSEYRGKGIAQLLILEAIERAKKLPAKTIDLTSRPEREVANKLYVKLGFVQRDTNVYRFVTPINTLL
jgi:ribosomal protein S18 acetylase RimI-like enzyme